MTTTSDDDSVTQMMKVTAEASLLALAVVRGLYEPERYDEYLHNLEEFLGELPQETRSVLVRVADELKFRAANACNYCL